MKKIILLLVLIFSFVVPTVIFYSDSVNGIVLTDPRNDEDTTVYGANVLKNEMTINGISSDNWNSSGSVLYKFNEGVYYQITINLSNVYKRLHPLIIDVLSHPDYHTDELKLYFYFNNFFYDSPPQIMSVSNLEVNSFVPNSYFSLVYTIDADNLPSSISFTLKFDHSDPDVKLGFWGSQLKAVVSLATDDDDTIFVQDYSALPISNPGFLDIESMLLIDSVSNTYRLSLVKEGVTYFFNVAIPDEIDLSEIIKEDNKINMSYSTDMSGNRILYIQPNPDLSSRPNLNPDMDEVSELMVGFAALNLTSMEYSIVDKLSINALVNKESQDHAYAYLIFNNFHPDDVLAISMSYRYQYTYLFRTSEWFYHSEVYSHGEFSDGKPSNWLWFIPGFGWGYWLGHNLLGNHHYDVDEILEPVTVNDFSNNLLDRYEQELDGNRLMLEDLNLYKVHLGQFRQGLSVGYNISNLAILNIIYIENGQKLSVPYKFIDSDISYPDPEEPIIELPTIPEFVDKLGSTMSIILAVTAIGVVILIIVSISSKIKKSKTLIKSYKQTSRRRK